MLLTITIESSSHSEMRSRDLLLFFGPLESFFINSNSHIVFTFYFDSLLQSINSHSTIHTDSCYLFFGVHQFVCLLVGNFDLINSANFISFLGLISWLSSSTEARHASSAWSINSVIFFTRALAYFRGRTSSNQPTLNRNRKNIKAAATRYRRVFSTGDQLTQCGARRLWRRSEAIVESVKSSLSWAQSSLSSFAQTSPSSLLDQFHALTLLSARLAEKQHKNC